ncbi:MAG: ribbon-helix-helix domain-containing protein [Conexivisphaerales archaeon]
MKTTKYKKITGYLDETTYKKLKVKLAEEDKSINEFIREAVVSYLAAPTTQTTTGE